MSCTRKLRVLLKVTETSELRTCAICAALLTTCCLCPCASSSLTVASSKETLSKKRQLQREAWMYVHPYVHVKGEKDTWQHVLKTLRAALQPSSHLSTRLFCPKAAGEQATAKYFSLAGGRQAGAPVLPELWADLHLRGQTEGYLPNKPGKHQCNRPAQRLLIPSTFCFHLPLASRTRTTSG